MRRLIAVVILLACFLSSLNIGFADSEKNDIGIKAEDLQNEVSEDDSYFFYYEKYSSQTHPDEIIELKSEEQKGRAKAMEIADENGAALYDGDGFAEWQFSVEETGVYNLFARYYPLEATGKDIQVSVTIDNALPYSEAGELSLPRIWKDAKETDDGTFAKDSSGNELCPEQTEAPRWNIKAFTDVLGMYSEPYLFYLTKGTHTLKIKCTKEALVLQSLTFKSDDKLLSYEEYISRYKDKHIKGDAVRQEAETAYEKTSSTLYPAYDRSNSSTLPNDPYAIRFNTIGGETWAASGAAVSYEVPIEKAGLYRLSFRVRQNFSDGLNAYRKLYINGKIPFKEAQTIVFPYNQGWYLKTFGDEKPYYVYLEKGDIITLECTSGTLDYPLREVQQAVLDLNEIYRSVIMITGISPSLYEDYSLDAQIPNLAENISKICKKLNTVTKYMENELGKSSAATATIKKAVLIFEELAEDTYFIPDRLSNFKGSIESLASLLLTLGGQGIELDCLFYAPENAKQPTVNAGFFEGIAYDLKRFLATFTNDYNTIGNVSASDKKAIKVWAAVGRDQAQIINRLIEEEFTYKTKIPVILNLVTGDATLIKATLAGKGPDVSLTVAQGTPVNLAARGALADLSEFDLSSLRKEIYESAWTPFEYNGGIYAVPESMAAEVLFYRTDIFKSLRIEAPDTWDDFYHVMEVLQSNNLAVGIPEINSADQGNSLAIGMFTRFLYQYGGKYYNDSLTSTAFDTEEAYKAFEDTVELYRVYGLSRDISFYNRFRSGDAPMGIGAYSLYTQLVSAAPEIRGLWEIKEIPGTKREDGTVDRTEGAAVTGCIMMASAKKHGTAENAFEFMKWWAGEDVQTAYGKQLEGVLGVIGRITPANRKVLYNLDWTKEELAIIDGQLTAVINPPQVLGNYNINRSLTSAIRGAINDKNTPRRSLALYNKDINDEIMRKRKEFKLDQEDRK